MAKLTKSVAFKNATIEITNEENEIKATITEYEKDDTKVYDLLSVLNEYNGIDGISLTIKQDSNLASDAE